MINLIRTFLILPMISFIVVSCNSDGPEVEQPEKIYYDHAQRRRNSNNFNGAIESLEAIENMYPFGKYAEQAQVELIYAHFMNSETEAAHSSAEKFIRLHPRHPNIDYAYFMKGPCNFWISISLSSLYLIASYLISLNLFEISSIFFF